MTTILRIMAMLERVQSEATLRRLEAIIRRELMAKENF